MKNTGFTLTELLVTILIISIISIIAMNPLLSFLSKSKTKQNAISVEQFLQEARVTAKTKSEDIEVVFEDSKAEMVTPDGTVLNTLDLEDKIKYDTGQSTITGNTITFNFQGSPVGPDGKVNSFTESAGKIAICYYSGSNNNCLYTKIITILPVTGIVKLN